MSRREEIPNLTPSSTALAEIVRVIEAAQADYIKFTTKSNVAAGGRVRASLLKAAKLIKALRSEVQLTRNSLKAARSGGASATQPSTPRSWPPKRG